MNNPKPGKTIGRFSRIRPRIVLTFSILFIVISAIVAIVMATISRNDFQNQAKNTLLALTASKEKSLETFIKGQDQFVENLAASQVAREELKNPTAQNLASVADRLNRTVKIDNNLLEIFMLDSAGRVVVSTGSTPVGIDRSSDAYYTNAKDKTYFKSIYQSEVINQVNYTISSPIKDDDNNLLGIMVARYKPDDFYSIVTDRTGLGKTGEYFVVNADKYFLSPSLFLGQDAVLKEKADTVNTRTCFEHANANEDISETSINHVFDFPDYRNVEVIGTHVYMPEVNWCLVGKIDKSEIYSPINRLLWVYAGIGIASIFIIIIISYILASRIAKPLEKLHHGTEIIAAGNLDYKVGIETQDEIGQLAREFDNMTAKIKESRSEVDKKVEEQTREIVEKSDYAEKQQKAMANVLEDLNLEKKKIMRSKAQDEAYLSSIGDGIIAINQKEEIVLANPQVKEILGFEPKEIRGKKLFEVIRIFDKGGKELKEKDRPVKRTLGSGKKVLIDNISIMAKSKKLIPISLTSAPIKLLDEVVGVIDVFRDVTKERQIDQAKTEFVSLASHQLRTPLSTINWYSEMLLAGDAGKVSPEQKKYIKEIYIGNQRMVDLVNALLNVSRIELGTLAIDPKPTDFVKISRSVLKELAPKIKEKKMKIIEDYEEGLPKVKADEKLVRIVFQNLLSNAVKYTPEKGEISVSLSLKKPYLRLKVKDTGYGIPEEQQNKIFTKLFRADNVREKETDGTGLGLYVVKAIIDAAKGRIWFKSKENKGTAFFVKFPLEGMERKEGSKELEFTK